MTTQIIQLGPEEHESGTAALQISGALVTRFTQPELVEIAIVDSGATERYLDPRNPDDPWTTSVYYFWPLRPRSKDTVLWLEIDHGVTYHLGASKPYRLRLRSPEAEGEEVFVVRARIRRPSTPPSGWTPPPDPRGPVVAPVLRPVVAAPVPEPAPAVVEPAPAEVAPPVVEPVATPAAEVTAAEPLPPPIKKGSPAYVKWGGGVVLLAAVAGLAMWMLQPGSADGAIATVEQCRKHLQGSPEPAKARATAQKMAAEGRLPECQFLLAKYAGEHNDAEAARLLGLFYDPETWSKEKSPMPAPNPVEAARWHQKAAELGDVESQYRFGMLLKLGRTDDADGPEKAQVWLRKAADAGHAEAKTALSR